jgi:hypothetical protein
MSTDRFMNLAQEISEQLKVVPESTEFRAKIIKLETKFKNTVTQLAAVYPTAEPGSREMTRLMGSLDQVEGSMAEVQGDINHQTGELRALIESSAEVIEALKRAITQLQQDPEAVLTSKEMYEDKQELYRVGFVNMWVKIVISALLILVLIKSFGYTVMVYVCVVIFYFLVQALKYLFTKYPASAALVGKPPDAPPPPIDCATTQFGCCEWNGTLARVDLLGSNCPARQRECPAANVTSANVTPA